MPSYSTHCIFARELVPFLYENVNFELNEEAVMIGTQGPDIFFFCRIFPWMKGKPQMKTGIDLHHSKPAKILDAMREYCEISNNKDIAKSYVYGFILHYALDRKCHPYVYYLQYKIAEKSKLANAGSKHNEIEFAMDSYLLNKRYGIENPVLFDTACTVGDTDEVLEEIGKLWKYVAKAVLDKDIDGSTAATAIRDLKATQGYTHDATGAKKVILGTLETLAAPITKNYKITSFIRPRSLEKTKKYANIDNKQWKSPFDSSIHNESFEDLFEIAKVEARDMILAYQNGDDTYEITHNISFLTGVEVE